MAEGKLYQTTGPVVLAIQTSIEAYTAKYRRAPACVRVRPATLGENAPAWVANVQIIADERVQPGCYLCCEGVEE
jgi:hypothetical protein